MLVGDPDATRSAIEKTIKDTVALVAIAADLLASGLLGRQHR
jgi:hypothetical protein